MVRAARQVLGIEMTLFFGTVAALLIAFVLK